MDTSATEVYRGGVHGTQTDRIDRLVISVICGELENWQRATVREFAFPFILIRLTVQAILSWGRNSDWIWLVVT